MRDPRRLALATLLGGLIGAGPAMAGPRAAHHGHAASHAAAAAADAGANTDDAVVSDPLLDAALSNPDDPAEDIEDVGAVGAQPAPASRTVLEMSNWVLASGDNGGLPYIIIDKQAAEVFAFDPIGQPLGAAPALLGLAAGDDSTPGIGDRELSAIRPDERTTPAGRFMAGFGPAWGKQKVFWVDYATAISLHPVIAGSPKEHRRQRLASASPRDNRITFGCINVPPSFFNQVIRTTFAHSKGVVYVLPEVKPLAQVFPAFAVQLQASRATDRDAGPRLSDAGPPRGWLSRLRGGR